MIWKVNLNGPIFGAGRRLIVDLIAMRKDGLRWVAVAGWWICRELKGCQVRGVGSYGTF